MQKLLSILGAVILTGTASTNVVACCRAPTPNTRTDISNKITNPIDLGKLDENTQEDFLEKLQTALAKIPDLNAITPSNYDV